MDMNLWRNLDLKARYAILGNFFPKNLIGAIDNELLVCYAKKSVSCVVEKLESFSQLIAADRFDEALKLLAN